MPRKRSWKRWVKPAAAVVTFLLTSTAGVLGIKAMLDRDSHSRTQLGTLGSAADPTTLVAVVSNEGKGMSEVLQQFRLEAAQPEIITFGTLTLISPHEERAIPGGQRANFLFDISRIRATRDVRNEDFWTQYGDMPVTLAGQVRESNGKLRDLKKSYPLSDLKPFIQLRTDPPR